MAGAFLSDIQTLRKRAREHIAQGAVTPGYHADRDVVLRLLNEALATEIVCTLRYKRHYFMATGINADAVAQEFLEHATAEQQHADQIAIDSYKEMVTYLGERDPTTRRMMEGILAVEEEHADDMASLLAKYGS